jgi:hypothetical protein
LPTNLHVSAAATTTSTYIYVIGTGGGGGGAASCVGTVGYGYGYSGGGGTVGYGGGNGVCAVGSFNTGNVAGGGNYRQLVSKYKIGALRYEVSKKRAKCLLLKFLDEVQKKTFEEEDYIKVIGNQGGQYHIKTSGAYAGNVYSIHHGKLKERLCCHIPYKEECPTYDHFLAQFLMIKNDEKEFRRKANITKA